MTTTSGCPTKLEVQRRYMAEHPRCAAVHSAVCVFYADGAERIYDKKPSPLHCSHALKVPDEVSIEPPDPRGRGSSSGRI